MENLAHTHLMSKQIKMHASFPKNLTLSVPTEHGSDEEY